MFFHNLKYAFVSAFKVKSGLIWTLIFPIVLATLMNAAFSGINDIMTMLETIPVAVVSSEQDEENGLKYVLSMLAQDGDNKLIDIIEADETKAKELLENETVKGIIYTADESLVVKENGFDATVLQIVLKNYKQIEHVYVQIIEDNPAILQELLNGQENAVAMDKSFCKEIKTTEHNLDLVNNFFYAIFGMSCLFASFLATEKIGRLQANISALGMRRGLASTSKTTLILAEYVSMLIFQFFVEMLSYVYMKYVLKIGLTDDVMRVALILLFGSSIGICFGILIGVIPKLNDGARMGILVGSSMAMSVMADLCATGVKDLVEHNTPIINRINPAVLISDSFYSLYVYDTYDKFNQNILTLGIMSAVLIFVSVILLRRNKYASV